jgi:hypothetical protein
MNLRVIEITEKLDEKMANLLSLSPWVHEVRL